MSDRPTPETDDEAISMDMYCDDTLATVYIKRGGWVVYGDFVLGDFARKLERERDEAREELQKLEGAYADATNYYARMIELRDELDQVKEELKNKTYDKLKS